MAEHIVGMTLTSGQAGEVAAVERLIADGAEIKIRVPISGSFDDDYTPVGLPVREHHTLLVRLLLHARADPRRTIGLMRGSALHDTA